MQVRACCLHTTWPSRLPCCGKLHAGGCCPAPRPAQCLGWNTAVRLRYALAVYHPSGGWDCCHVQDLYKALQAHTLSCMLQVYDLLVACGWMAGSHTSAPSAAALRADGQPPPGSIVKCDPLEAQMHPVFSSALQAFPGFHPGPFQT